MLDPPVDAGASHVNPTSPLPGVAVIVTGAPGVVTGVTADDDVE
jgi:hypothetical protein